MAERQSGQNHEQLVAALYDRLRAMAGQMMTAERAGHTLQPTALVHEAYVRFREQDAMSGIGPDQFLGIAAMMVRRVLVDHARARAADKRGGDRLRVSLSEAGAITPPGDVDLVELDDALARLEQLDPRKATLVQLRFFGGLTIEQACRVMELSPRTLAKEWTLAKAFLRREMVGDDPEPRA